MKRKTYLILAFTLTCTTNVFAKKNTIDKKEIITHVLNRLTFGPSNNEILFYTKNFKDFKNNWLNQQMNPDQIEDQVLENKLRQIKSLDMEPKDNLTFYKKPEELAKELKISMDDLDTKKEIRKEVRDAIGNSRFPEALIVELQSQKMLRAVESKKQLQEVLVDFWYNYFNIDAGKNEIKYYAYDYENNVIRKNVFKSFKDILSSSAHHPAMLVYLDNRLSKANAINENYAREIMELHTLGVDGGYTQKDVQELARIFTGWTTSDLKIDPQFIFRKNLHDKNEKNWLGIKFEAGGDIAEGEKAIDILANHPKTAEHVCKKLAIHFINDQPSKDLLKKCTDTFIMNHGDLKKVYTVLFTSDEFLNKDNYSSKIKKPFHYIASSVRAMGGEILNPETLLKFSKNMGEELYRCVPPTGYKDDASSWVNPGAMIARLQFALDLSSQNINGVLVNHFTLNPKNKINEQIDEVTNQLGLINLSNSSRNIIAHEIENEPMLFRSNEIRPSYIVKLTGLLIGSPEFQRR